MQGPKYLQIARSFLNAVCSLETNGLAHCDLSNNNFIIDTNQSYVELIDIEDMYAPELPRPVPDISYGTPGYRNHWIAENGLWGPESDRFASAILCAEILTWQNKEIRALKGGETSFFNEDEIGSKCERFQLMQVCLENLDPRLSKLFQTAWYSKEISQCPPVREWKAVIDQLEVLPAQKAIQVTTKGVPLSSNKPTRTPEKTMAAGIPPKMEISHSILSFGVVNQNSYFATVDYFKFRWFSIDRNDQVSTVAHNYSRSLLNTARGSAHN